MRVEKLKGSEKNQQEHRATVLIKSSESRILLITLSS